MTWRYVFDETELPVARHAAELTQYSCTRRGDWRLTLASVSPRITAVAAAGGGDGALRSRCTSLVG